MPAEQARLAAPGVSRRAGELRRAARSPWRHVFVWAAALAGAVLAGGREVIPPAPPRYFNDFAGVVSAAAQSELNERLAQFERETSNQIVVAIYPTMESDSSIEDYATRVYQAWGIGQKGKNNGALLLVFTQSHRMRIQTGYGLEGAMPDALCARIMRDDIAPHLRAGDWAGGMRAGVNAMMAAAQGEYKGTGRTVADRNQGNASAGAAGIVMFVFFILLILLLNVFRRRRTGAMVYGRRGPVIVTPPWWGGGGWGGGNSGSDSSWGGSGSSGGGSDSGFSGGGGSTGGGGASGSW